MTLNYSGLLALLVTGLLVCGCSNSRRMTVITGTTIGLHSTPGDGQATPPQIAVAYKRGELAIVPTGEKHGTKTGDKQRDSDAYSSLAILDYRTYWLKDTTIDQFIATGHAARDIQEAPFTRALARGTHPQIAVIERGIYTDLQAAAPNNTTAALVVNELDKLGKLAADEYTYIETSGTGAAAMHSRKYVRTPAPLTYLTYVEYRERLVNTITALSSAATVPVTEIAGGNKQYTGDELKKELTKHQTALRTLEQSALDSGAPGRALQLHFARLTEKQK
jgi:hypothetical protein